MPGRRVFVTGLGGELGSLVGTMLEAAPWVESVVGVDTNPPRRRLRTSRFRLIDVEDADRIAEIVEDADPHTIVHVGVWEPHARLATAEAEWHTDRLAEAVFAAAHRLPRLESFVLRSGVEVTGTGGQRGTSTFGRMLHHLETRADELGAARGVSIARLRLAPVVGAHVPSPLGRLLRLPAVPFHPVRNPSFSVVEAHDAARSLVAAAERRVHDTLDVVAPGAISVPAAARRGRRLAVPTFGPGWWFARNAGLLAGAPIPDHVVELLTHGRVAASGRTIATLGMAPERSTVEVIDRLYAWPSVIRIPASAEAA